MRMTDALRTLLGRDINKTAGTAAPGVNSWKTDFQAKPAAKMPDTLDSYQSTPSLKLQGGNPSFQTNTPLVIGNQNVAPKTAPTPAPKTSPTPAVRINPLTGKPFGAQPDIPKAPAQPTTKKPLTVTGTNRYWSSTKGDYQDMPRDNRDITYDEYQAAVGRKAAPAQEGLTADQQRSQDYQDMQTRVGYRNAQDERKLTMLRYLRSQGVDIRGPGWENSAKERQAIRNVIAQGYGQFLDPGTLQTALRLGLDQPAPRYGRQGQDTYAGRIYPSTAG